MVGFLQQNNLSTKFLKAPKQFCIWPLENGWLVADLSFLWVKLFCCKKPFNEELMTSPKERKLSFVSIVTILGKICKCKEWKEVKKTIYLSTQFLNNPFLERTSFSKAKWEHLLVFKFWAEKFEICHLVKTFTSRKEASFAPSLLNDRAGKFKLGKKQ